MHKLMKKRIILSKSNNDCCLWKTIPNIKPTFSKTLLLYFCFKISLVFGGVLKRLNLKLSKNLTVVIYFESHGAFV